MTVYLINITVVDDFNDIKTEHYVYDKLPKQQFNMFVANYTSIFEKDEDTEAYIRTQSYDEYNKDVYISDRYNCSTAYVKLELRYMPVEEL